MITEEINLKFLEFLELILSLIADETKNSKFKEAYQQLDPLKAEENLRVDFNVFYLACLIHIIFVIHGIDKFAKEQATDDDIMRIEFDEKMKDLVKDLHFRHLKKHLHRFCAKYGVPVPDLETYGISIFKV